MVVSYGSEVGCEKGFLYVKGGPWVDTFVRARVVLPEPFGHWTLCEHVGCGLVNVASGAFKVWFATVTGEPLAEPFTRGETIM